MVEGFLFDRVHACGDSLGIDQGLKLSLAILTYSAETSFAGRYRAGMGAQEALDNTVLKLLVKQCFFDHVTLFFGAFFRSAGQAGREDRITG